MVSKSVETFSPTVDTDTMIKTEMLAAMIPYSIAVVPFSLSRKRRIQRPVRATKLRIALSVCTISASFRGINHGSPRVVAPPNALAHQVGSPARSGLVIQLSPEAAMQLVPLGRVTRMVQVPVSAT